MKVVKPTKLPILFRVVENRIGKAALRMGDAGAIVITAAFHSIK